MTGQSRTGRSFPPGYLAVISEDGEEIAASRRVITGLPADLVIQIEAELRRDAGPGCYVVLWNL